MSGKRKTYAPAYRREAARPGVGPVAGLQIAELSGGGVGGERLTPVAVSGLEQ